MPSELANKAISILSPVVGEFMAKARILAACKRMNVDIEAVDKAKLTLFADHIEAVCLNLGPEAAKGIKQKVLAL